MDERVVEARLNLLGEKAVASSRLLLDWEMRTGDYLAPQEYRYRESWYGTALPIRAEAGTTIWARTRTDVLAEDGSEHQLRVELVDAEGLLSLNGRAFAGVDQNHTEIQYTGPGGTVELLLELAVRAPFGGLQTAAVEQVHPDVKALYYDLAFAWSACRAIRDPRRQGLVHQALEQALLMLDLTKTGLVFLADVRSARTSFWEQVGEIALDPEMGTVAVTGHSHIDVAWLWPLKETVRKSARTFATACRLMEEFPDYQFSCSQPQLYAFVKDHYPDLYQDVKHWIKQGRWEPTGGMWVEADCNVTSGESLIRQILYGLQFAGAEFGFRPRCCWLPDVFGYPASLPEILKGCGLTSFFTCKLHWQAKNRFPHQLFRWVGLDGSEVLAHIPYSGQYYNNNLTAEQLVQAWENHGHKVALPETLLPTGHGDGGGGTTRAMMEYAVRAAKGFPGVPRAVMTTGESWLARVDRIGEDLPSWDGELYLETHRGTLTTHAAMKAANRRSELDLRDCEVLNCIAAAAGRDPQADRDQLFEAWQLVLLNQFHDILPGSSIGAVYVDAAKDYSRIKELTAKVQNDQLQFLGASACGDISVFNSLSWTRGGLVGVPKAAAGLDSRAVRDALGNTLPLQPFDEDLYFYAPEVPGLGRMDFAFVSSASSSATEKPAGVSASPGLLENQYLRIELNDQGELERVWDKEFGRDVLSPGSCGNVLQLFQDGPEKESAWNVHETFEKRQYEWDGASRVSVSATGPVWGALTVVRQHRDSMLKQEIRLYAGQRQIDFVTEVDWQERQTMLKAAFPIDVRSVKAAYEVQFGAVERPTHRNTSWDQQKFETAAHRWIDLAETGYGVSLLNDCKYGHDARGNVMRITLLRGTEQPDPDADRGEHRFTYSLYPHAGDWVEAKTVRAGWELNAPLLLLQPGSEGPCQAVSFLDVQGEGVVMETLKPAEDGRGMIARFYESCGGRTRAVVNPRWSLTAVEETNLVEEHAAVVPVEENGFSFELKPFQIRTFRLLS